MPQWIHGRGIECSSVALALLTLGALSLGGTARVDAAPRRASQPNPQRGGGDRGVATRQGALAWAPPKVQRRFVALQHKLPQWLAAPRTDIYVTGLALTPAEREIVGDAEGFEQRTLGMALGDLQRKRGRVVWVGSRPIDQKVLEFHGERFFGGRWSTLRERLSVISLGNDIADRGQHLAAAVLDRPDVLSAIRGEVDLPAVLHVYSMNASEANLAVALEAAPYGISPAYQWLGSKSGSRTIFGEALGQPGLEKLAARHLVPGQEWIYSSEDLVAALIERFERGDDAAMVKLDGWSFSEGNLSLHLSAEQRAALRGATAKASRGLVLKLLEASDPQHVRYGSAGMTWKRYQRALVESGAVVEQFIPEALAASRADRELDRPSLQFMGDGRQVAIIGSADTLAAPQWGLASLYAGPSLSRDLPAVSAATSHVLNRINGRLVGPGSLDTTEGRFNELNLRHTAVTSGIVGPVIGPLARAKYDPRHGVFVDRRGQEWHFVGSHEVGAHVLGPGKTLRGAAPSDVIAALDPLLDGHEGFVMPGKLGALSPRGAVDDPQISVIAAVPGQRGVDPARGRERALRLFGDAIERLRGAITAPAGSN